MNTQSDPEALPDDTRPPGLDNGTIAMAYRESRETLLTLASWFERADAKVVTIFSVSGVIAALVPALRVPEFSGPAGIAWGVAIIAWIVAAAACFAAYSPRGYRLDPLPPEIFKSDWLSIKMDDYVYYRLRDVKKSYQHNYSAYASKVKSLRTAVIATAVEIAALVTALVLTPPGTA